MSCVDFGNAELRNDPAWVFCLNLLSSALYVILLLGLVITWETCHNWWANGVRLVLL